VLTDSPWAKDKTVAPEGAAQPHNESPGGMGGMGGGGFPVEAAAIRRCGYRAEAAIRAVGYPAVEGIRAAEVSERRRWWIPRRQPSVFHEHHCPLAERSAGAGSIGASTKPDRMNPRRSRMPSKGLHYHRGRISDAQPAQQERDVDSPPSNDQTATPIPRAAMMHYALDFWMPHAGSQRKSPITPRMSS